MTDWLPTNQPSGRAIGHECLPHVVVQFDCPRAARFWRARACPERVEGDLGEPRDVSRFLRNKNRAFGSLPHGTAPPPCPSECCTPHRGVLISPYSGGSSSAVERQLPKLDVVGSIPIARSNIFNDLAGNIAIQTTLMVVDWWLTGVTVFSLIK